MCLKLYVRYMDDGRSFLQPLKRGWRWYGGGLQYSQEWASQDKNMTPLEVTARALKDSMNEVEDYLEFTVETCKDFEGGEWLPTLDTSIRVNGDNQIQYKYFEKPTTTNTTIRKDSAMAENCKIQILAQDLVRRLHNTKEDLPADVKKRIVDGYAQKVLNGGYTLDQVRKIIVAGIKGYFCKTEEEKEG